MIKNQEFIELLRHYRHDWLNILQLIKGNIALNRLEQVDKIICEMVAKAEQETKLSNLRIPSVACFLLTYHLRRHFFRLEYEVIGEVIDLSKYEQDLYSWFEQFFLLLDRCCSSYSDNSLIITFHLLVEEQKIILDFEGYFEKTYEIEQFLNKDLVHMDKIYISDKSLAEQELVIEITLLKEQETVL